jgi:hypothetical protein
LRGSFQTAPPPDRYADVAFTVISCSAFRSLDHDDGFHIFPAMSALRPRFFVHTGDNVYYDSDIISANGVGDSSPAIIPLHDTSATAKAGSATPDENSSMKDFGECTGCAKGERGGLRSELQQSNPALKQVPIGADDDGPFQQAQQTATSPPIGAANFRARQASRPIPVG